MGKPRKRITTETFAKICRDVAGGKSLRKALRGKGMPSRTKFFDVVDTEPELANQYARARQRGIEIRVDEILDLVETATQDNAHVVRLKVDTMKWFASKLVPKIYGDRQQIDLNARITAPDLAERLRRARERAIEVREREINALPALEDAPADEIPPLPDGCVLVEDDE